GRLSQHHAALKSHKGALDIFRKALPKDHPEIAQCLTNLGGAQRDLMQYEAARKSYEEALAIQRKGLPKDHPDVAHSLHNLAVLAFASGRDLGTVGGCLREAVPIDQKRLSRLALGQPEAEQFLAANKARVSLDLLLSLTTPTASAEREELYALVVGCKG